MGRIFKILSAILVILFVISAGFLIGRNFNKTQRFLLEKLWSKTDNLKPVDKTKIASIPLPDNRNLPQALTRLDIKEESISVSSTPKVISKNLFEQNFNTIDKKGKYFGQGIYQTSSGKYLASGFIKDVVKENGLKISLMDEFGNPIEYTFVIPAESSNSFPVGLKNTTTALDLRENIDFVDKDIYTILLSSKLDNSKIVIELKDFTFEEKVLEAKAIYLK